MSRHEPVKRTRPPVGNDAATDPDATAATGAGRPGRAAEAGEADSVTAEREDALVAAVVKAIRETGAHVGSVFLRSQDSRSIVLAATCGASPSLLGGWRLIPVNSPIPVAAAYRSGRTVHLADAGETMRRYPQLAVALPYAFGSASVPVRAGQESLGALAVVWSAPPGHAGLSRAQLRHLRAIANRLGAALADLRARGGVLEYDATTVPIEVPPPTAPAVRVGLFDWRLDTGAVAADDELCAIFGLTPGTFDGRADTLASRLHPGDRVSLRATARAAIADGRVLARRLRIRTADGYRSVELWGRVPEAPGEEVRSHLVGCVLDAAAGSAAVTAVERLRDGLFSLAPDGRVTYANRSLEQLLGARVPELLGRRLWDVLPWLSDPVYEDRHRTALVSQQPTTFLVCRPPDRWLAFSLHPDTNGVTGRVAPSEPPHSPSAVSGPPLESRESPGPPKAQAAPARLGAIYRVLQLGSALTEAVTTDEVCNAVGDQLLPAFGGQHLAIYVIDEGRLHLLFHTGYHDRFLHWLEGKPLDTPLPGTETLTSGVPLFIESRQDRTDAYPAHPTEGVGAWAYLPLIASNRPVGTCILGFDEIHHFTTKDRSILTALSGLIAQALERARLYDAKSALAHGLQNALLPHRLPVLPGIRTTGRYLPGTSGMDIGGDWYDVIPTGSGVALVVGDVEGHSVAAAGTMGQLRSAVRAFATAGHSPSAVLAGTNRLLVDLGPGLLASCCYIRIEPGTDHAYAVRAGHCPPLLRRPDGSTDVLELAGGPLLGVDGTSTYPETRLDLPRGSILALYTDGLVEERGSDIDLGIDDLRASLAHARAGSLEELADQLLRKARHSSHRSDDIALLLTEYHPEQAPQAG
ncbi:SpoIIE family protein phosphatase [Kitasatospora atroaurantiaca]|uniref:protein-serine/threonine phosphatase n=1 Tax=Kitasatospora atroaurantiaca TaxID=285545 RepID=A0A561EJ04_9ACTN|nr:SpoIIE family protein phosphatase [Kitasatospora atroaurantiaca]TWE15600.1 PAS domain-containing protein [Kitasatospora atroaurantiaca]